MHRDSHCSDGAMMGRSKFSQFIHRGKLKKIILKTAAGFENEMVSKVCLQRQNMPHNATFHQDLHFLLRQKLLYICYYFYLDFYLRRFSESRSSSGSTPSVRLFVRTSVRLSSTLLGCLVCAGFYTKLNVWGSLGLNFEYDGGPIIEIGGPIFLYKLRILEGSTSFPEGSVLSPGQ